MPYLEQIYEEWSDKGLVMLAVDVGESASQVRQYMQSNTISLLVLLDTSQVVTQTYNITGYPTTFFIDKDGIIQEKVVGAFQDKESIEQCLSKIIP
jgi:thiol-disulfide isomerase/thioredoxin